MAYLDKKDYFGYAIIGAYTMCAYFLSKLLEYNFLTVVVITVIASVTAVFLSKYIYHQSNILKFGVVVIPFLILTSVSLVETKNYFKNEVVSNGIWLTDNSGDLVIKLRASDGDSIFLSISPGFEEVGYKSTIKDDTLFLKRYGEVKLKWYIKSINTSNITLRKNSEELVFRKKD